MAYLRRLGERKRTAIAAAEKDRAVIKEIKRLINQPKKVTK